MKVNFFSFFDQKISWTFTKVCGFCKMASKFRLFVDFGVNEPLKRSHFKFVASYRQEKIRKFEVRSHEKVNNNQYLTC